MRDMDTPLHNRYVKANKLAVVGGGTDGVERIPRDRQWRPVAVKGTSARLGREVSQ